MQSKSSKNSTTTVHCLKQTPFNQLNQHGHVSFGTLKRNRALQIDNSTGMDIKTQSTLFMGNMPAIDLDRTHPTFTCTT